MAAPPPCGVSTIAMPLQYIRPVALHRSRDYAQVTLQIVDAFCAPPDLQGNPAAVCLLDRWPESRTMQELAAKVNLPETAFAVGAGGRYGLRWFTPTTEVTLCGHATLAAGRLLLDQNAIESATFDTKSGLLEVHRHHRYTDMLEMDFPARTPSPHPAAAEVVATVGAPVSEWYATEQHYIALLEDERAVASLSPDIAGIATLDRPYMIVTARGNESDFVSRFFAPAHGIAEDAVTGSAHCVLTPLWARRLGKQRLRALQLSERGGEVLCGLQDQRVTLGGRCRVGRRLEFELRDG